MYIVINISAGTSDLLQGEKLRCFTPYFKSVKQHNESAQTAAAKKRLHKLLSFTTASGARVESRRKSCAKNRGREATDGVFIGSELLSYSSPLTDRLHPISQQFC